MKKILLTILFILFTVPLISQVEFTKEGEQGYYSKPLYVCDNDTTVMELIPIVNVKTFDEWVALRVKKLHGNACIDADQLVINLRRGGKVILDDNEVEFNCEGVAQFRIDDSIEDIFRQDSRLYSVRLINGRRTGFGDNAVSGKVPKSNSDYFIRFMEAVDNFFGFYNLKRDTNIIDD